MSDPFSASYAESRDRFVDLAHRLGAKVNSHAIAHSKELTIDVATLGPDSGPTILITSGLHGVEGFAGTAIQIAFLRELSKRNSDLSVRYVLVHALNPFGFANLRRVDEDNVDLNRNFLTGGEQYSGGPSGYAKLNHFLNPGSPPGRVEPFKLKALYYILRMGMPALKESVAGGQYEFPDGLFYGGAKACATTRLVEQQCTEWVGNSDRVIHLDIHTGLGSFGDAKLLLTESTNAQQLIWYEKVYGKEKVELLSRPKGTAYKVTGLFCHWMQARFSDRDYRAIGAEFGTYNVLRVLSSLRAENRAHRFCEEESPILARAKQEMLECFCPASPEWRRKILDGGLDLIRQSEQALLGEVA